MELHLIRHGETIANEKKLYCGHTDLPLSEKGRKSVAELKKQDIYPNNVDMFFSSNLCRTRQTIEHIYLPEYIETLPELAEFNFGQYEMKSYEKLKENPDYQAWITDESGLVSCPGGENKQQFNERVLLGYNLLLQKSQNANVVFAVSHGGVIASIMDYLFPDTCNFYEWQPRPGHGYTLIYNNLVKNSPKSKRRISSNEENISKNQHGFMHGSSGSYSYRLQHG